MIEIDNFYNGGFGWVCRACERELAETEVGSDTKLNRIMREGEAESKQPRLSNLALARWADKTRQALMCPRCGIVEQVDKA
jgi:ribosomal protein S14